MGFNVSVRHTGTVAIIDLSGRVVLGESSIKMRDAIKGLPVGSSGNVLVNLKDVPYLDSSGLRELVTAYTSIKNAGGQLKLLHVQKVVKQLFEITRLNTVFESFDDEAVAIQSFTSRTLQAGG